MCHPHTVVCSKQFQKILTKQGLKFKLNTKVTSAEKKDGKVFVNVEGAKGGNEETLEADVVLVSVGRRPVTEGLGLEKIGVEVDKRGRIVIDDQYNTTVKGIKCIGDVTFGPMLAHKAEEEGKLYTHPTFDAPLDNNLSFVRHCRCRNHQNRPWSCQL